MARMSQWIGMSLIGLTLVGCVSQEKYNSMKLDRDQLAERLGQSDSQLQSMQAERDAYKAQLDRFAAGGNNQVALVNNLTQQLANLQAQYDTLNRQYQDALSKVGGSVALPEPLTNALQQFASENPDLVEFDSTRGIVKFKSDITFTSGSAEITARAREAISRFASILNSPVAASYELIVAGHTDNQKVVHEGTLRAGHKDNWYLSAHRAIEVSAALQRDGINSSRLGVEGFADQHPVSDNNSAAGRAQNRRVEVLILPTTVRSGSGLAVRRSSGPSRQSAARRQARTELNKDAATDQRQIYNYNK